MLKKMSDNYFTRQGRIEFLEKETYAENRIKEEERPLIGLIIQKHRVEYFLLQLHRFWYDAENDIPPYYDGKRYKVYDVVMLTPKKVGGMIRLKEILTGLEAELVQAADRRGFKLKRRPCDLPPSEPRRRSGGGEAPQY